MLVGGDGRRRRDGEESGGVTEWWILKGEWREEKEGKKE